MDALRCSVGPATKVVPRKPREPFVGEDRPGDIRKDIVLTVRD